MARIPDHIVEEIRRQNDIVEVISKYVQLKAKSANNYAGLCPFHQEKTPSFSVSSDKQLFHCFGCGKGGDVTKFIMLRESLSYPEALRFLAKEKNIKIPEYTRPQDQKYFQTKQRQEQLLKDASDFFVKAFLAKTKSAMEARAYAKKRQLSSSICQKFSIGYADTEWQSLTSYLQRKSYTEKECLDSGLVKKSDTGRLYDFFRDRLIFPIKSVTGTVIAFGGRSLLEDKSIPKYLNSPETQLYHKGKHLYGLSEAKRSQQQGFILTEGYMDAITLQSFGFSQAIACLGTALTTEQVALLKKYGRKLYLCLDSDLAGQEATLKSLVELQAQSVDVSVVSLQGEAKDPDEYLKKKGKEAFQLCLDHADTPLNFKMKLKKKRLKDNGLNGFSLNQALEKEALDLLAQITDKLERDAAAREIAVRYLNEIPEIFGEKLAYYLQNLKPKTKVTQESLESKKNQTNQSLTFRQILKIPTEKGRSLEAYGLKGQDFKSVVRFFNLNKKIAQDSAVWNYLTLILLYPDYFREFRWHADISDFPLCLKPVVTWLYDKVLKTSTEKLLLHNDFLDFISPYFWLPKKSLNSIQYLEDFFRAELLRSDQNLEDLEIIKHSLDLQELYLRLEKQTRLRDYLSRKINESTYDPLKLDEIKQLHISYKRVDASWSKLRSQIEAGGRLAMERQALLDGR